MFLDRLGLNRLFKREEDQQPPQPQPAAPPPQQTLRVSPNPGTRVLIVDDSKTIHAILGKTLHQQGYEIVSAYDGKSGVEMARLYRPALIIMDVVMPGLNGFQATRLLRRDGDAQLARIPVIIMSGNEQATEQFWSIKIGANDFLAKPFTDDALFGCIEKCLYPSAHDDVGAPALATVAE